MYDLEVHYLDGSFAAVEVVAAADADAIELWNLVNDSGKWTLPMLVGGWMVELRLNARANVLRAELQGFLETLEAQGVRALRPGRRPRTVNEDFADFLGIRSLLQTGTDSPGSVYFTLHLPAERSGGMVADDGNALATWIGLWLGEDNQQDVVQKLRRAETDERHAFVLLPAFTTAHFGVVDLLMRRNAPLPTEPPSLPDAITHVWAASTWTMGDGFRWSASRGWTRFEKLTLD